MEPLARCGVDLLLAGHLHVGRTGHTAIRYKIKGHSALVIQAGTATSTRHRGETNSFNVVRVKHPYVNVERLAWQPERAAFAPAPAETFRHTPGGRARLSDGVAAGITFEHGSRALQPGEPHAPGRPLSGDKAGRESDKLTGNKGVDLPARPAIDFSATPRRTTG